MDEYIVYKTTNLINKRVYIGVHKIPMKKIDNYLGSGKLLNKAITKYRRSNFVRETLFSYNTEEEAYTKEGLLVNEEFISKESNYNLVPGGKGGYKKKSSNKKLSIEPFKKKVKDISHLYLPEVRDKISNTRKIKYGTDPLQSKNSIEKARNKMINLYGSVTGHFLNEKVKLKRGTTFKKKFGSPFGKLHSKEAIENKKSTCLEKYGSPYGKLLNKESREKGKIKKLESTLMKLKKEIPEYLDIIKVFDYTTNILSWEGPLYLVNNKLIELKTPNRNFQTVRRVYKHLLDNKDSFFILNNVKYYSKFL